MCLFITQPLLLKDWLGWLLQEYEWNNMFPAVLRALPPIYFCDQIKLLALSWYLQTFGSIYSMEGS